MKLKKYFPLFAFVLMVSGYLCGQLFFSSNESTATQSEISESEKKHFESIYQSLEVTTTQGDKLKLSEVKSPIVILNFWASWCKPCLQEFPSLVSLAKRYTNDQIKVIGINSDYEDQEKNIKKTVDKYKLNFDNVADVDNKVLDSFLISAIPVSIIYHHGKVVEVSKGEKDFVAEETIAKLDALLKK